jgi:hypothetical protein
MAGRTTALRQLELIYLFYKKLVHLISLHGMFFVTPFSATHPFIGLDLS